MLEIDFFFWRHFTSDKEGESTYDDFLVDEVLALGTLLDKVRGQAHDDDGAGPLQGAGDQLQRPGDGS